MDNLDYDPNDPNSLLKYLRLNNIFAPTLSGSDSNPVQNVQNDQTPGQSNSMIDPSELIKQLMSPNEEMFNRMKSQVDSMPLESNFKDPSLWTKIRAHLAAGGADNPIQAKQTREGIEHAPYLKALNQWKMQLEPTEKLAQFENTRNVNNRLTGTGILRDEQTARRNAEIERKNKVHEEDVDEDRKIRQQRADAYDFKSRNPDFKTATDSNGELIFYDPKDPSKVLHSGIQTGKLSDIDKVNLQHEGRLEEIQARTKSAKELESDRQSNRLGLETAKFGNRQTLEQTKEEASTKKEETRQTNRVTLKQTPSASQSGKNAIQSETQKKQGQINKALKIISENPELKSYIIFEKNNAGTVQGVRIAPSGIFGDEAKRMKAYNLLFGQEPVPGVSSDKNVTPQSNSNKPTIRADGKTHVKRKSDGQVGWVTNPDMSKYDLEP